ncbi:hypothetical protein GE21DRAFT_1393 [Neurospora crassa]|uniref:Extracellular serine-rich protein n=1 Tax=Neurospora crassa (strain ATCC 24698 / 74-OR23-1A / CBS 708.71 / DSM 1257 / FGSC 987) TaxID=367110 RepID=Q7SEM6_NEUCR|nr:hypothetical protein NCU03318 [Neurospora crassa OR74A]EAA35259.2 hypothetical protein NCU03318 [Neurospora crassa OR74A]KHE81045.1 hypothetical protein GE21DRAFT_1393 [Neurospora crassa]|eukprot:XP_964495.2 hypothetical protein NCU03318 [Neurospora crassa OR74A]
MYGSRLFVGVATAALSITAAAQTLSTPSTFVSNRASSTSSSTSISATPTRAAGPNVIVIEVGKHGHIFEPHEVTDAKKGDVIRFNFYPTGHSVARAEFEFPCFPWELYHPNEAGMWSSGENYTDPESFDKPLEWQFTLDTEEPMFFYCSARTSCSTHKMIGVINPNATHSWDAQRKYAEQVTYDLKPGETWKAEDPNYGKEDGSKKSGLSAGAIAGIAIGAAAVVAIAAALVFFCGRRGGFQKAYRKSAIHPPAPGTDAAGAPTMVEAQYHNQHNPASPVQTPAGLKSPGQASFTTFSTYPHMDPSDPYRSMTASPQQPPYPYGTPPPQQNPGSPGSVYGYNTYNGHAMSAPGSAPVPGPNSPLMIGELSSVPHSRDVNYQAPVELPSGDGTSVRPPSTMPGSPPPQYESGSNEGAKQGWTVGEENQFQKR